MEHEPMTPEEWMSKYSVESRCDGAAGDAYEIFERILQEDNTTASWPPQIQDAFDALKNFTIKSCAAGQWNKWPDVKPEKVDKYLVMRHHPPYMNLQGVWWEIVDYSEPFWNALHVTHWAEINPPEGDETREDPKKSSMEFTPRDTSRQRRKTINELY